MAACSMAGLTFCQFSTSLDKSVWPSETPWIPENMLVGRSPATASTTLSILVLHYYHLYLVPPSLSCSPTSLIPTLLSLLQIVYPSSNSSAITYFPSASSSGWLGDDSSQHHKTTPGQRLVLVLETPHMGVSE
ncbi:hypothetical protein Pcinc_015785 [Petrolisthes cinctipes]|uniref:Uncharacterized protein n=1 Tax=Petrolisthes cinctipes TaxID=88211 RepID=A0AAE1FV03_PETCI|nr:hypothetical protein Pcinc_015785 [Petrolisthes cinctipes]